MKKLSQMTASERSARVRKLIRDPGTRAAVPDKYLPQKYLSARQAQRQRAADNATTYNPLALLSGQGLRRAVNSEVDLQTRPQLNELDRQIGLLGRTNQTQADRLHGYFGQAQQNANAGVTAASNAQDALAQQLAGISSQNSKAIRDAYSQAQQAGVTDQALRGSGLDAGTAQRLAAVNSQAQAAQGALSSAQAKEALSNAGAATNYAGTIAQTLPAREADQLATLAGQYHKDLADLQGKRADVMGQRANLRVSTLDKLRQSEFDKMITAKTLGIKQMQAAAGLQPSASDQINAAKLAFFQKHGYWPPTGPPKSSTSGTSTKLAPDKIHTMADWLSASPTQRASWLKKTGKSGAGATKGLTPHEKLTLQRTNDQWRSKVDSAISFYKDKFHKPILDDKGKKVGYMDTHTLRQAIAANPQFRGDKLLADIVLYQVQGLPIPSNLISQLKNRSVGVPSRWTGGAVMHAPH